jgi:ribose/xylose/arabinose/galactoside ABC-type transport system permease subunit
VLIKNYEGGATEFFYQPGIVILIAIAVGAICGLWNGILVAFMDLQPIIATLILMVAGRGVAQLITGGQSPATDGTGIAH